MIMKRLAAGDDSTLEDCLAYCRTIASTYEVTEDAMYNTNKLNLSDFLSTAYFAKYMHDNSL